MALEQDNSRLRTELNAVKKRFGLPLDRPYVETEAEVRDRRSPSPTPQLAKGAGFVSSEPPPLMAINPMHQVCSLLLQYLPFNSFVLIQDVLLDKGLVKGQVHAKCRVC